MQFAGDSNKSQMDLTMRGAARLIQAAYLLNLRRPAEKGPHPVPIWHADVWDDVLQNVGQLHSKKYAYSRDQR